MIVIVFGLPGSGKSYFAVPLAKRLGAGYLNTDQLRKEMFSQPTYSREEKRNVYKRLLDEMCTYALAGKSLVMDGTFYDPGIRGEFKAGATGLGIELKWIEICADERLIKKRVAQKRTFTDANFNVYLAIKRQYVPMKASHLCLISTGHNLEEMLLKAMSYLTG